MLYFLRAIYEAVQQHGAAFLWANLNNTPRFASSTRSNLRTGLNIKRSYQETYHLTIVLLGDLSCQIITNRTENEKEIFGSNG